MTQLTLLEVFNRIEDTKKKIKEIKKVYADALTGSADYQEVIEKIKTLRARKKQIEETVQSDFQSELAKLDDLKIDLQSDQELLNDAALTKLMKGETVEVEDENGNKYDPHFSVKFKKA